MSDHHERVAVKSKELLDVLTDCTSQEGTAALISASIKWCETMRFHGSDDAVRTFAEMLVETRDQVDRIEFTWP